MALHLAERIAATLSFSTIHWREDGQILAPPWTPIRLRIQTSFTKPSEFEPLLVALGQLLATPYSTDQWGHGTPILWAGHDQAADAHILLLDNWAYDHHYLAYEARFPHSDAVFRGSFSLS
jgi:hypothetical protein